MPSRLTFLTTTGQEYVAIFKHGDDLRQDQLILQIITLMDKLLRRENLDLKLTPYRVLATSSKHGIIFNLFFFILPSKNLFGWAHGIHPLFTPVLSVTKALIYYFLQSYIES